MSEEDDEFGYFCVRKAGDDYLGFSVTDNLDEAKVFLNEDVPSAGNDEEIYTYVDESEPGTSTDPNAQNRQSKVIDLAERFIAAMSSTRNVVFFATTAGTFIQKSGVERILMPHATNNFEVVEERGESTLYRYRYTQYMAFKRLVDDVLRTKSGYDSLPGAILLSLVATFDSYFGEIVRAFLEAHPERYSASNRTISLKDVFLMESIEEVTDHVISEEVSSLMRQSHQEQVAFVEANLDIRIKDFYERWAEFIEVFERRNLVAHGKTIVNKVYVTNCVQAGSKFMSHEHIGTSLRLDTKYLLESVDILTEFGLLLIFVLWKKHLPGSDERAFTRLNQYSLDFISQRRFKLSERILTFGLHKQKRTMSDRMAKMMTINLANAQKKQGDEKACKKTLDTQDWSASGIEFQISAASLNGEVDKVVKLLPGIAATGAIGAVEFRDWPVFDWVRDDPAFSAAFASAFGEPLQAKTEIVEGKSSNLLADETGGAPAKDETLH